MEINAWVNRPICSTVPATVRVRARANEWRAERDKERIIHQAIENAKPFNF